MCVDKRIFLQRFIFSLELTGTFLYQRFKVFVDTSYFLSLSHYFLSIRFNFLRSFLHLPLKLTLVTKQFSFAIPNN